VTADREPLETCLGSELADDPALEMAHAARQQVMIRLDISV
jgi:hypothetical protein